LSASPPLAPPVLPALNSGASAAPLSSNVQAVRRVAAPMPATVDGPVAAPLVNE